MTYKPFVYITSPYTKGDTGINTKFQLLTFTQLMDDGLVFPYAPLVSHFIHVAHPRSYEDWISYDIAMIHRMDALLMLNAEYPRLQYIEYLKNSSGAKIEKTTAEKAGIPIFYSIDSLYHWCKIAK